MSSPILVVISLGVSKCGVENVFGQFVRRNVESFCHKRDSLMRGSAAFVYSVRRTTHTCSNLYWTVEMLMTRDGPAVNDAKDLENREFFIPHMHSTPARILIVLSRQRHTISDGDVALEQRWVLHVVLTAPVEWRIRVLLTHLLLV